MPALNMVFTDAELERIRAAASAEGVSLKSFVRSALEQALATRTIEAVAASVADRSRELNARLAR